MVRDSHMSRPPASEEVVTNNAADLCCAFVVIETILFCHRAMETGGGEYCAGQCSEGGIDTIVHFELFHGVSFVQAIYTYGARIFLVIILLAITIFRKEMSCNRCYATQQEENRAVRSTSISESVSASSEDEQSCKSWDERDTESFLEEAGCYGSGTYVLMLRTLRFLRSVVSDTIATRLWESLLSWWIVAAEAHRLDEILEGAGNWCVNPPPPPPPTKHVLIPDSVNDEETKNIFFPAAKCLPTDAMVHILSFVNPKDVVSLAGTNRALRTALQDESSELSNAVWKILWRRDYGWIVEVWEIGQLALQRSLASILISLDEIVFTQTFYFRFGVSYVNYIVAGHCTADKCLVGLGGHIYDITEFIDQHPGSPETVMVNSGRDASSMFESRHTISARNLAQQLCVIVDTSLLGKIGPRPTAKLASQLRTNGCYEISPAMPIAPHGRTSRTYPFTLASVHYDFLDEQEIFHGRAAQFHASLQVGSVVGDVHPYYDPFAEKWKAWYMSTNFEAVFVDF
jgi:Cytochrome b5-like Heme/Steroid binding domain/F-box domain